jgi:hypothetical protein
MDRIKIVVQLLVSLFHKKQFCTQTRHLTKTLKSNVVDCNDSEIINTRQYVIIFEVEVSKYKL